MSFTAPTGQYGVTDDETHNSVSTSPGGPGCLNGRSSLVSIYSGVREHSGVQANPQAFADPSRHLDVHYNGAPLEFLLYNLHSLASVGHITSPYHLSAEHNHRIGLNNTITSPSSSDYKSLSYGNATIEPSQPATQLNHLGLTDLFPLPSLSPALGSTTSSLSGINFSVSSNQIDMSPSHGLLNNGQRSHLPYVSEDEVWGRFLSSEHTFIAPPADEFGRNARPIFYVGRLAEHAETSYPGLGTNHSPYLRQGDNETPIRQQFLGFDDSTRRNEASTSSSATITPMDSTLQATEQYIGDAIIRDSLLQDAFAPHSLYPSEYLRACLDRLLLEGYLNTAQMEPTLDSEEGRRIRGIHPSRPRSTNRGRSADKDSINILFIRMSEYLCMICGKRKGAKDRAIGCVRKHLNHRPFRCLGKNVGCSKCGDEPAQFFLHSYLSDHLNGQSKRKECPQCHKSYRRGGMMRHWKSEHKGSEFPYKVYPRYKKPINT